MNQRAHLKALAKVTTLAFDIADYKREIKGGNGNCAL